MNALRTLTTNRASVTNLWEAKLIAIMLMDTNAMVYRYSDGTQCWYYGSCAIGIRGPTRMPTFSTKRLTIPDLVDNWWDLLTRNLPAGYTLEMMGRPIKWDSEDGWICASPGKAEGPSTLDDYRQFSPAEISTSVEAVISEVWPKLKEQFPGEASMIEHAWSKDVKSICLGG